MKRFGTKKKKREDETSRPAKKRAGLAPKVKTKHPYKLNPYADPKKKVKDDKNIKTTEEGRMGT